MNDIQKEQAARKLCELRGIDPEKKYHHDTSQDEEAKPYTLAWVLVVDEIEKHLLIDEAINFGKGQ